MPIVVLDEDDDDDDGAVSKPRNYFPLFSFPMAKVSPLSGLFSYISF